MPLLAIVRLGVAVDAVVAWVESLDDALDRAALAAGVGTLHDDEQPGPDLAVADLSAEPEPEFEEAFLGCREALLVLIRRQFRRQIDLIESSHAHNDHTRAATTE